MYNASTMFRKHHRKVLSDPEHLNPTIGALIGAFIITYTILGGVPC